MTSSATFEASFSSELNEASFVEKQLICNYGNSIEPYRCSLNVRVRELERVEAKGILSQHFFTIYYTALW